MKKPDNALGPLIFDLKGTEIDNDEAKILENQATGGVILFTRNYVSTKQLISLVESIRAIKPNILIAVDHEGGRVQRFKEGFTRIPAAQTYRTLDKNAEDMAELTGWLMAMELRSINIDISFAPVLDINYGLSEIIGDRAFGGTANEVTRLAGAFMKGMDKAGMAATGKHFPGHGGVVADSHVSLPYDTRDMESLKNEDMVPFKQLIQNGMQGIMPAHVVYSSVDTLPAGYSKIWLQHYLRNTLGFDGVIFSDDLSMAGAEIAGDYCERARMALDAGCDMILICNNQEAAQSVLEDKYVQGKVAIPNARIMSMKGKFQVNREKMLCSREWMDAVRKIQAIT